LGATTVLCVDKTGTLTVNRMEVAALFDGERAAAPRGSQPSTIDCRPFFAAPAMASVRAGIEPMDKAIHRLLDAQRVTVPAGEVRWREGVTPGRPFVSQGWSLNDEQGAYIAIKGAPEAVLARCADSAERLRALALRAEAWSAEGRRVIAVAVGHGSDSRSAADVGWQAVGLIAFEDPLRDDVPEAIAECQRAGHPRRHGHRRCAGDGAGDRAPGRAGRRNRSRGPHRRPGRRHERSEVRAGRHDGQRLRRASCRRRSFASSRHCSAAARSSR
jgi:Ca2+-transporting ATPase